jgi:hypothetical protein
MAKLTTKSSGGTSFYDSVINVTPGQLVDVLGIPQHLHNDGRDKVNMDWTCETKDGTVFTIYDWKEYRPIGMDETIEFHIGGFSRGDTEKALKELKEMVK